MQAKRAEGRGKYCGQEEAEALEFSRDRDQIIF